MRKGRFLPSTGTGGGREGNEGFLVGLGYRGGGGVCSWEVLKIMNAGGGRFGFVWGYSAAQRKTQGGTGGEREREEAVGVRWGTPSLYVL